MAKLDRDGVKIHYEVHGPGNGTGPTILLSHGYSSTSRMWDGQVAVLKDRYQVVVWDMRGHGESDYPKDQSRYSEALTVGDMAALLDTVGAALAGVRRVKSDAKVGMRAVVSSVTFAGTVADLDRLRAGAADLAAAGRLAQVTYEEGDTLEVRDAVLAAPEA